MNLLLLFPKDFVSATRVRVSGRRIIGDDIVVGIANGRMGTARVVNRSADVVELKIALDRDPPAPLPLTLILALPRPKVLNRLIAGAASMGVKRIILINAWRVEKSYWKSPRLDHLDEQAILGLEQARDPFQIVRVNALAPVRGRRHLRPRRQAEDLHLPGRLGDDIGPEVVVPGAQGSSVHGEAQALLFLMHHLWLW